MCFYDLRKGGNMTNKNYYDHSNFPLFEYLWYVSSIGATSAQILLVPKLCNAHGCSFFTLFLVFNTGGWVVKLDLGVLKLLQDHPSCNYGNGYDNINKNYCIF